MSIIVKRLIKSLFILAGILFGVFVLLLFCMYFLNVNIFGYQGVSGSVRGTRTEVENLNTLHSQQAFNDIEVRAHSIPVNIRYLNQAENPTANPRIELVNNLMGIVKRRIVPEIDSSRQSVDVYVLPNVLEGTLIVRVFEPKLVMAGWSNSCLNIFLTAPMMQGKNIYVRTNSSKVTVDALPSGTIGSINVTGAKNEAVAGGYDSASHAKLVLHANAGSLLYNSKGGNLNTATAYVTSAKVLTNRAGIVVGDVGNLVISTNNSRVVADKVNNFAYFKYDQEFVVHNKASGGLIDVESITGSVELYSSAITISIGTLSCNLNLGDFDSPTGVGTNAIRADYANVSINTFVGENISICGTSGRLIIKEMYKMSGATHQTQKIRIDAKGFSVNINTRNANESSSIDIKTTSGGVTINGGMLREAALEFFTGEIKITTESGKVYLSNIMTAVVVKTTSGDVNFRLRRPSTAAEQLRVNNTFIVTQSGAISILMQTNTRCLVNVIAQTRKMNLLDLGFNFSPDGMPTLMFEADSLRASTPLFTFIANRGSVTINEAYGSEF